MSHHNQNACLMLELCTVGEYCCMTGILLWESLASEHSRLENIAYLLRQMNMSSIYAARKGHRRADWMGKRKHKDDNNKNSNSKAYGWLFALFFFTPLNAKSARRRWL